MQIKNNQEKEKEFVGANDWMYGTLVACYNCDPFVLEFTCISLYMQNGPEIHEMTKM